MAIGWMSGLVATGLAAAWVALEPGYAPALRLGGAAPDLLLVLAIGLSHRPRGGLTAAVLLGALRDAVAGSPRGAFIAGYVLAALLARALLGRAADAGRPARLLPLLAVLPPAALAAHLPAALLGGAWTAGGLLSGALLTALLAPAVLVPQLWCAALPRRR